MWDGQVHTLYLKWIIKKDLLYNTRDSTQHYLAACVGGQSGGEWIHMCARLGGERIHMCARLSHFAVHLNHSTVNRLYSSTE